MNKDIGCLIVVPMNDSDEKFGVLTLSIEEAETVKKLFEKRVLNYEDKQCVSSEYVKAILED